MVIMNLIPSRFHTYVNQTMPIVQYYEKLGLVRKIPAELPPDEVKYTVAFWFFSCVNLFPSFLISGELSAFSKPGSWWPALYWWECFERSGSKISRRWLRLKPPWNLWMCTLSAPVSSSCIRLSLSMLLPTNNLLFKIFSWALSFLPTIYRFLKRSKKSSKTSSIDICSYSMQSLLWENRPQNRVVL